MANGTVFKVVVSAGSLRPDPDEGVVMPHQWTTEGVLVQCDFTGAHLYHLAAAGCVLNDIYREADHLGVKIEGARVCASGAFDESTWQSTGVEYEVDVATEVPEEDIAQLLDVVDEVAEIPKALRLGTTVVRRSGR